MIINYIIMVPIELPKAERIYEKDKKNRIGQWMIFLEDPNKEEVIQIMEDNKTIKKAIGELEQVSGDEKLRRIAELREKAIRDEHSALAYAKEEGLEQGIAQGKVQIAKNMLKKKMSIEDIKEITGLTEEEIQKLQ